MRAKPEQTLDATDERILEALKRNARISNIKLAELIGISAAPCLRRVKALESSGIITGYQACVDREKIGLNVMAFSEIQLKSTESKSMLEFEKAVAGISEIKNCYVTSGGWDYILEIQTTTLSEFETLSNKRLNNLPWVRRMRSRFALRRV